MALHFRRRGRGGFTVRYWEYGDTVEEVEVDVPSPASPSSDLSASSPVLSDSRVRWLSGLDSSPASSSSSSSSSSSLPAAASGEMQVEPATPVDIATESDSDSV